MNYCEEAYNASENPWVEGCLVEDAVPGYWEDMTEAFGMTPFYRHLRINPEYGIQQYPIADVAPDMALPNIIGNFFYRRTFVYECTGESAVLHFEGVQNAVSVWLNDSYLGRHEGYSAPFDFELPENALVNGENTLVLSVSNHRLKGYGGYPVSGLTSRAANECTGGITGDVELRVYHSPLRDVTVNISDDCREVRVWVDAVEAAEYEWAVYDGTTLCKSGIATGDFHFETQGLACWSPEHPKLYTLAVTCHGCVLHRKFGLRKLTADGVHFKLNGQPYFLRGICEHCHFAETVHPHHDIAWYRNVIQIEKKLGFNFTRFHTYIPPREYMQAADELGMLLHVESPNNTTLEEWKQIVKFCKNHPSVVIYCCGNELQMEDDFIEHIRKCADEVHQKTDSLFSPMSAMRGVEYCWIEEDQEPLLVKEPFTHHPRRLQYIGEFSDLYSSYALGRLSYDSLNADVKLLDAWSEVYNKPRVSHEICIDGTYADLSLKDRYKGLRYGATDRLPSIEHHLETKGLLAKAPLYFRNSSEWQRRIRKHCFEAIRRCENMAGFDFLGPVDTHWHTFGYDVGMMNEFFELKPGESIRNVLMYNSPTVLLNDLGNDFNFTAGEELTCSIYTSHYGVKALENAQLLVLLVLDGKVVERRRVALERVENGHVSKLYEFRALLPEVEKPAAMKMYVSLDGGDTFAENEWELYLFPRKCMKESGGKELPVVADSMTAEELKTALQAGKDVLLLGTEPFDSLPTSFRIALAGRTAGNLATVISDHPLMRELPHEGFCGWQFRRLLEGGSAVRFESDAVPFQPIIEVVSTHKFAIRQSALFEYKALKGRLLVCSLHFQNTDPAACWLKEKIIAYMQSKEFVPRHALSESQLDALMEKKTLQIAGNTNFAMNTNDKTAVRKR